MNLVMYKKTVQPFGNELSSSTWYARLKPWLFSWEMYLITLVAGFLRLYRIDTTIFFLDQANIFRMAVDAIHHGMLVATANGSSIGTMNPPAIIYFLMPAAFFSTDPLWAAVWFALLITLAVPITYIFVRRYYGRLAGSIAASLFAVVNFSVSYSRFIWNPNLLLLFAPLFIMTLFRGVVDRRKGWLFPAIFLLGLMYQFHSSSLLLVFALLVAVVLAPGTIRWRDLIYAGISLFILYAPYLLWEVHAHFQDISMLLTASKQPAQIDSQALGLYQLFLGDLWAGGFALPPAYPLLPIMNWVNALMTWLLVIAGGMILVQIIRPRSQNGPGGAQQYLSSDLWGRLRGWWIALRADPERCGLLVLLVWQVVPLAFLSRHSLPLYEHYFLFFLPGQYILIALLLARVIEGFWSQHFEILEGWRQMGCIATCLLLILLIATQFAASMWYLVDWASGNFMGGSSSQSQAYTLSSVQHAVHEADQLAQQRHLKHLYIAAYATYDYLTSLAYLAEHTSTPTAVFSEQCLVLPHPAAGPAVLLVGPYNDLTGTLLPRFASATLVDEPPFLGESPFKLYIVQTKPVPAQIQNVLPRQMQFLDTQRFSFQKAPWVVTRWNVLRSVPTKYQTTYAYKMIDQTPVDQTEAPQSRECFYTSIQKGDQLLIAFPLSQSHTPTSLNIQVQSYKVMPTKLQYMLFNTFQITFETGHMVFPPPVALLTSDGKNYLLIPLPG